MLRGANKTTESPDSTELRACCRVRATTLYERLAVLADTSRVVKTDDGYRLADS